MGKSLEKLRGKFHDNSSNLTIVSWICLLMQLNFWIASLGLSKIAIDKFGKKVTALLIYPWFMSTDSPTKMRQTRLWNILLSGLEKPWITSNFPKMTFFVSTRSEMCPRRVTCTRQPSNCQSVSLWVTIQKMVIKNKKRLFTKLVKQHLKKIKKKKEKRKVEKLWKELAENDDIIENVYM